MNDAGSAGSVVKKSHIVAAVAFIALLVGGLFLIFSDRGPSGGDAAANAADASKMSEAELIAANREPLPMAPAPATADPSEPPALTPAWLAGTWRPAADHDSTDPNAPCETDVIVTFLADGRYEQGDGSSGRFRTSGDQEITLFEQVIRELGTDEEDRSEFGQDIRQRVVPIDQNTMRVDGEEMRRCRAG